MSYLKIHHVIPACVLNKIQSNFSEPDGVYVGYTEDNNEDDDTEVPEVEALSSFMLNIFFFWFCLLFCLVGNHIHSLSIVQK